MSHLPLGYTVYIDQANNFTIIGCITVSLLKRFVTNQIK